jgi:amino acid permease
LGKRYIHIIVGALLLLPFLFAKSTKLLSIASTFSIISIIIFIFITGLDFERSVTIESLDKINILPNFSELKPTEAIIAFPALFVAFTFHYNFFPVLESLKNPTNKRMQKAGNFGVLFPLLIYLAISSMGYMTYGNGI